MDTDTTPPAPAAKVKHPRLTPPQIELLTDIATHEQMFIRARYQRSGGVLVGYGLATMRACGPSHQEIIITRTGWDEARRRGLVPSDAKPPVRWKNAA